MADEDLHGRMIHNLLLRSPCTEFNMLGNISRISVVGEDNTVISEIFKGSEISIQDVLRSYMPSDMGSKGQHYGSCNTKDY